MFDTSLFNMDWPHYQGGHNHYNSYRRRGMDPRAMMNVMMFPHAGYDYCDPERLVEIPIRHKKVPKSMSTEGLHHQRSNENCRRNYQPSNQYGVSPNSYPESWTTTSQSRQLPRNFENAWEIPVQHIDRNCGFRSSQQSHRCPQSQSPECQSHAPVSVPIIHKITEQKSDSRAMSEPPVNIHKGQCMNSRTDPSNSQVIPQSQCQEHHVQKPQPDTNTTVIEQTAQELPSCSSKPETNKPDLEDTKQIPSTSEQQDLPPQQPPQPEASPEEKAQEIINAVMEEVKALEDKVKSFNGSKNDKQYRYLEEMLTRSLIKLDSVESGSNESIRQSRKQTVRYIEAVLHVLELGALVSKVNDSPSYSLESQNENDISQSNSSIVDGVESEEQMDADCQDDS